MLDEGQRMALLSKLGGIEGVHKAKEEALEEAVIESKKGDIGTEAREVEALMDEFGTMCIPEGSLEGSSQEPSAVESSVMDSIMTFHLEKQGLLQGTIEGSLEHSADLIAKRTRDIRDLIYMWENYYAMLGVKHRVARSQALIALLGYDPENYGGSTDGTGGMPPGVVSSGKQGPSQGLNDGSVSVLTEGGGEGGNPPVAPASNEDAEASVLENLLAQVRVHSYESLVAACDALEGAISIHFRRQFSKYIRLVDIPQASDLGNSNISAESKKHKSLKKSGKRVPTKKKSENPLELAMQLEAEDAAEEAGELDGDGEIRDDGANEKDEEERAKALGHGVPIHTDKRIKKILDYDMKLGVTLKDVIGDSNLFDDMSIFSGSTMTKYPSYEGIGPSNDDNSSIASARLSLFDDLPEGEEEDGPRMMDMKESPLMEKNGIPQVTFKENSSLFDDDAAAAVMHGAVIDANKSSSASNKKKWQQSSKKTNDVTGPSDPMIDEDATQDRQVKYRLQEEKEKTEMELLAMLEEQAREGLNKQREQERANI